MKEVKPGFFIPDVEEYREIQYLADFGAVASEARKKCNLTFRAAAEEIGITAAYLSDIEKGKEKPPTRKVLNAMIKVYKLSGEKIKEFDELAARARGTLSLTLVNLFNGYSAARHIAYTLADYRDYLEDKQGVIDDEEVNKQLGRIERIISGYIEELMEKDGE
jgi:transcriptional regulator with XRE-family HTH domain